MMVRHRYAASDCKTKRLQVPPRAAVIFPVQRILLVSYRGIAYHAVFRLSMILKDKYQLILQFAYNISQCRLKSSASIG